MADEPHRKDPQPPAEPAQVDDPDQPSGPRNEPTDDIPPEVVDDDRFQEVHVGEIQHSWACSASSTSDN